MKNTQSSAYAEQSATARLAPFAVTRREPGPLDVGIELTTSPATVADGLRLGAHEVVVSGDAGAMQKQMGSFDFIMASLKS